MSDAGDPVTHISGGFLRIKGRIMRCWVERKDGFMCVELWGQTSTGNRKLDGTVSPDTPGPNNEVVENLWCFPVMCTYEAKILDCLLLQPSKQKGTFRRFGVFTSRWDRKEGTDPLKDAYDLFDKDLFDKYSVSSELEYEESKEGKKYTITII